MINKNQLNEKAIKSEPYAISAYKYMGFDSHQILVAYNRVPDRYRYEKYLLTYWKNGVIVFTRKVSSIKKIKEVIRVLDGLAF